MQPNPNKILQNPEFDVAPGWKSHRTEAMCRRCWSSPDQRNGPRSKIGWIQGAAGCLDQSKRRCINIIPMTWSLHRSHWFSMVFSYLSKVEPPDEYQAFHPKLWSRTSPKTGRSGYWIVSRPEPTPRSLKKPCCSDRLGWVEFSLLSG